MERFAPVGNEEQNFRLLEMDNVSLDSGVLAERTWTLFRVFPSTPRVAIHSAVRGEGHELAACLSVCAAPLRGTVLGLLLVMLPY